MTGFASLPPIISLDSSFSTDGGRRVLVPRAWLDDPPNINVATWGNELGEWRRLDDSLVFVPSRSLFHTLGNDSITVTWRGWGGWLTAYLAPSPDGYAGLGQLVPRPLAAGLPAITVRLRRVPCPRDSVVWALAPPNPRLQGAGIFSVHWLVSVAEVVQVLCGWRVKAGRSGAIPLGGMRTVSEGAQ